jgi:hypothetical protein
MQSVIRTRALRNSPSVSKVVIFFNHVPGIDPSQPHFYLMTGVEPGNFRDAYESCSVQLSHVIAAGRVVSRRKSSQQFISEGAQTISEASFYFMHKLTLFGE